MDNADEALAGVIAGKAEASVRNVDRVPEMTDPAAILRIVTEHRTRNELVEVDRLLAGAMQAFPNDRRIVDEYTASAIVGKRWDEACRRCRVAMQRFPDVPHYHVQLAWALHFGADPAEADRVLLDAARRFSDDFEVARDLARLALLRADLPTALARWEDVRSRFPNRPEGYILGTQPLVELGRFNEAEALLELCRAQSSDSFDFLYQSASIATRQRNWEEAFRRWEALLKRFPDAEAGQIAISHAIARWQLDRADGEPEAVAARLPALVAAKAGMDHQSSEGALHPIAPSTEQNLLMKFEGLGDGCEFGVVQRHFGAEPLGLLRWSNITPASLAALLRSSFSGVGEAEHTFVRVSGGEYVAGDRRHFLMHTFIREADMPADVALDKMMRRIRYLRTKLLRDLAEGEKVFVYKKGDGNLSLAEAQEIARAMQAGYPKSKIILARLSKENNPPGSLQIIDDRVAYAHLSVFSFPLRSDAIRYDEWRQICMAVFQTRWAFENA